MKLKALSGVAPGVVAAVMLSAPGAFAQVATSDIVWVDDVAIEVSLTGTPGDPVEGARVLAGRSLGNCVACHEVGALPDVQFQGNIGPMLDGTGSRWSEAELRGIVADAKRMFPDSMMPSFYRDDVDSFIRPGDAYTARAYNPETWSTLLTAQQIEDVVAYLMTLTD
jgi:sulfur-oxidizing protein SoxX